MPLVARRAYSDASGPSAAPRPPDAATHYGEHAAELGQSTDMPVIDQVGARGSAGLAVGELPGVGAVVLVADPVLAVRPRR